MKNMENGKKILIIGNDPDEAVTLAGIFEKDNCAVLLQQYSDFIDNPEKHSDMDCIIIEKSIWSGETFNLSHSVRRLLPSGIPVVFASYDLYGNDISEAFNNGADEFIGVPFIGNAILPRIYNQIKIKRRERTLQAEVLKRTDELVRVNELLNDSVNEYRKILKELQDNETLLLTIALNIPNSYLAIIEKNYTVGFASGQEFKKSNYDPWRLVGLPVDKIFKEKSDFMKSQFLKTFNGEEVRFELEFRGQYQQYRLVPLFNVEGDVERLLVVVENITEQKLAEDGIRESLKEKELLLKEIHHRVKNNMQLVCSLMSLQADKAGNADIFKIVNMLQSRILSISLVHENLYQHEMLSKIGFREYVEKLVHEIAVASPCGMKSGNVHVDINIQDEYFTIDNAIPCGLILNELVINAYRHAFCGRDGGIIKIAFNGNERDGFRLTVSDNGTGIPAGFNIAVSESMGMTLIRELVNQLGGEINIKNENGTAFTINFGGISAQKKKYQPNVLYDYSNKNILIVEDERIISRMLRKIIEDKGYNIIDAVSSGRDAIDVALKYEPDLIIMDIMLEDEIDGVQAASVINQKSRCPIIFLTGNSDPVTIKSALDTNPYQMLTKPVERYRLLDVIESVFR